MNCTTLYRYGVFRYHFNHEITVNVGFFIITKNDTRSQHLTQWDDFIFYFIDILFLPPLDKLHRIPRRPLSYVTERQEWSWLDLSITVTRWSHPSWCWSLAKAFFTCPRRARSLVITAVRFYLISLIVEQFHRTRVILSIINIIVAVFNR